MSSGPAGDAKAEQEKTESPAADDGNSQAHWEAIQQAAEQGDLSRVKKLLSDAEKKKKRSD